MSEAVDQRMEIWDAGYRAGRADTEEAVIDSMTPPPGSPDDAFWRGAQWAYRQVRDPLGRASHPARRQPGGGRMSGLDLRALREAAEAATPGPWERADIVRRFWTKVEKGPYCWTWTGHIGKARYGAMSVDGKPIKAHRLAWMIANWTEVPDGLVVDHICRNTACVRPDHLRAVSQRDNVLSGQTIPASEAAKEECIHGHPLSGANLYIRPNGDRQCIACRRDSGRRRYARRGRQTCALCGALVTDLRRHVREIHEGIVRPSRRAALDGPR